MKRAIIKRTLRLLKKSDKCSKEAASQIKFQGGNNYVYGSTTQSYSDER